MFVEINLKLLIKSITYKRCTDWLTPDAMVYYDFIHWELNENEHKIWKYGA